MAMSYYMDGELSNFSSYYWPFTNSVNNSGGAYEHLLNEVVINISSEYHTWIYSIGACMLVGLSGIFPLLIFPLAGTKMNSIGSNGPDSGFESKGLTNILCFAVGSLLGDVFLHLLPEAWNNARAMGHSCHATMMCLGFWVLAGIICFVVCEKFVTFANFEEPLDSIREPAVSNNNLEKESSSGEEKKNDSKHIAGYLNLLANGFDNFTHGLAVAGSFIIAPRIGFLTTAAILLHEIPHEIGDFAILLRSGFNPWSAAKAQLSTATVGIAGAIITLSMDSFKTMGDLTWWILPFTSGGFIHIAMTNLLPDLMKEDNPTECLKHCCSFLLGISVMALVTILYEV